MLQGPSVNGGWLERRFLVHSATSGYSENESPLSLLAFPVRREQNSANETTLHQPDWIPKMKEMTSVNLIPAILASRPAPIKLMVAAVGTIFGMILLTAILSQMSR
jgi:hypothetical protein